MQNCPALNESGVFGSTAAVILWISCETFLLEVMVRLCILTLGEFFDSIHINYD